MSIPKRTAVVFTARTFNPEIERRFRTLRKEAPGGWDVFLVMEGEERVSTDLSERTHRFDFQALKGMARSVIGERLIPGELPSAGDRFR